MDFGRALDYWLQDQRISGKSPQTTRTWFSYLRRFAAFTDPMTATHIEVRDWIDAQDWSPSCHKSARSALRSFYRLMRAEGWVRRDPMRRVPDGPRVRRRVQLRACEPSVRSGLGCSDPLTRWMVALAAFAGLRRSEIAQAHTRDLHDGGLVVHGKGDRERWVPLPGWLWAQLLLLPDGWLFPGRFTGHLHPATVQKRVKQATGYPPHALRRRYATRVYEKGGDLLALQHLLGHSSPATTELYVAISMQRLRDAAAAA